MQHSRKEGYRWLCHEHILIQAEADNQTAESKWLANRMVLCSSRKQEVKALGQFEKLSEPFCNF
jgi:hypothetical protein